MKTIYDFRECGCPAAVTDVPPVGMVAVAEALVAGMAKREAVSADIEVVKVMDAAVCGMGRPTEKQKAEI